MPFFFNLILLTYSGHWVYGIHSTCNGVIPFGKPILLSHLTLANFKKTAIIFSSIEVLIIGQLLLPFLSS